MSQHKPYIPVGNYALRVYDIYDKKLVEVTSPFNRVATHTIADLLIKPSLNDEELEQLAKLRTVDGNFTGHDFLSNIIKKVPPTHQIGSVKCMLITHDTKLTAWHPKVKL